MNFGWGPSELGGLREIHVPFDRKRHPSLHSSQDWCLWRIQNLARPQVALIEAWARRQTIPNADNSFVVSDKGKSLVKQTKGKNKSSKNSEPLDELLNTCKREYLGFVGCR